MTNCLQLFRNYAGMVNEGTGVPWTICYRVLLKRTSYVSPIDKRLPNERIYFIPRARQAPIRKVLTKAEFLDLIK